MFGARRLAIASDCLSAVTLSYASAMNEAGSSQDIPASHPSCARAGRIRSFRVVLQGPYRPVRPPLSAQEFVDTILQAVVHTLRIPGFALCLYRCARMVS